MKNKYVTTEELEEHKSAFRWVAALTLGIVVVTAFLVISVGELQAFGDKDLREFVVSPYNFTEKECMEWRLIPIIDTESYDCVEYCHTEQKQVGEECEIKVSPEWRECIWKYSDPDEDKVSDVAKLFCDEELGIESTTRICTSLYETKTGFCADGQVVRDARKLTGESG